MSEWRPIKTAPTEQLVLVYGPFLGVDIGGNWPHYAGWQCSNGDRLIATLTHWMPLPEPPKEKR